MDDKSITMTYCYENNKNTELCLHLGCGDRLLKPTKEKNWINCDILPPEGTTYTTDVIVGKPFDVDGCEFRVMDVTALTFEENTIDEIYASHVLDHLSRKREVDRALSEWYRVLKPGGILRVAVSDFEKVVTMYNEGLALERLLGHIVGGHKTDFDKHGIVFDFKLLRQYLEKYGFHDVSRYDWRSFLPEGFDDLSRCMIPGFDFNEGYCMSLNVQATKPMSYHLQGASP